MRRRRVAGSLGVLFLIVAGMAACGDDDDDQSRESRSTRELVGSITYGRRDAKLDDFRIWIAKADGSQARPLVEVPSWMSDWSPDGRQIVYEDLRSLQIINADGTGRRELLSSLGSQWIPEWSPTGEWITFEGAREEITDDGLTIPRAVWVVRPDGTGLREVTPGMFGSEPVFSPDGIQIAFGHVTKGGSWTEAEQAVEVINLDGTGRRQVVAPRPGLQHIDWSRDGWLVFNIEAVPRGRPGPADAGTIFAVRPDGSQLHAVRRADDRLAFYKPIWSPDGSMLLTGCNDRDTGIDKLCLMNADGTNLEVVVDASPDPVNFPAWGPMPG